MRTLLTFLGVVLLATVAAAGATYRWVEGDGVHYSDQPHPGAEKIFLGETQTYSAPAAPAADATPAPTPPAATAPAAFRYDSCAVVQPAEDQVLIDVEKVTVAVQVSPAKRSGDRVVLYFDKQPIEPLSPDQTEFQITPIDRGTHSASASVRDARGKTLCHSPAVTFHVRQPSVLAPLNPNNPARGH